METSHCGKCDTTRPNSEFTRSGVTGTIKLFRTYQENNNDLELIEPTNLSNHITELLNTHLIQPDNNFENSSLFHFQCAVDLSTFDKSTKEIVKELVESIEDADEFS
ncbi:3929_t:CDS:2, partial [Scutellospora calospora]